MAFKYAKAQETFADLLRTWAGFANWQVFEGGEDVQPENLPAIQVRDISVEAAALSLPGFSAGNRENKITYRLVFLAYNLGSVLAARQTIQDAWDALEQMINANPTIGGYVDAVLGVQISPDSGQVEDGGFVASAEVTINATKLV